MLKKRSCRNNNKNKIKFNTKIKIRKIEKIAMFVRKNH